MHKKRALAAIGRRGSSPSSRIGGRTRKQRKRGKTCYQNNLYPTASVKLERKTTTKKRKKEKKERGGTKEITGIYAEGSRMEI